MKKAEKKQKAEALHQELEGSRTVILSGFEGITVAQDFDLRRRLAQAGAKYKVVKNSLIERASQGTPLEPAAKKLSGTTSLAYTRQDPVALAKVLTAYAKENPLLKFKSGVVEGRVVSMADLNTVANLPAKEELLAKALFLIKAPARNVAYAVAGVGRKLAVVIQQAVQENRFGGRDRAAEPAAQGAGSKPEISSVLKDLKSAINFFLSTLPDAASIPEYDEAILRMDAGGRTAPGAPTPRASDLVRQLTDPERQELKRYYSESVAKIRKNPSEDVSGGN